MALLYDFLMSAKGGLPDPGFTGRALRPLQVCQLELPTAGCRTHERSPNPPPLIPAPRAASTRWFGGTR
jgi:hypothetical protein